jgi:hypothetical protein
VVKRGNLSASPAAAQFPAARSRVWPAIFFAALSLTGCSSVQPGSFDVQESGQSKWNDLVNLVQLKKARPPLDPSNPVKCPDIVIQDGTADDRVYGSTTDQSNANLRYQFSITDIARDCQVSGDKLILKAGVAGKLLLGPVGSPGNFTGPVRVAVINDNDQSVVLSKLYSVGVGIPAGQSEGAFSLVTEALEIPYTHSKAQYDYTIRVGFDTAGGKKTAEPRHRRHRAAASAD